MVMGKCLGQGKPNNSCNSKRIYSVPELAEVSGFLFPGLHFFLGIHCGIVLLFNFCVWPNVGGNEKHEIFLVWPKCMGWWDKLEGVAL